MGRWRCRGEIWSWWPAEGTGRVGVRVRVFYSDSNIRPKLWNLAKLTDQSTEDEQFEQAKTRQRCLDLKQCHMVTCLVKCDKRMLGLLRNRRRIQYLGEGEMARWRRGAARTRALELLPHLQGLSFNLAALELKPGLVTGVGWSVSSFYWYFPLLGVISWPTIILKHAHATRWIIGPNKSLTLILTPGVRFWHAHLLILVWWRSVMSFCWCTRTVLQGIWQIMQFGELACFAQYLFCQPGLSHSGPWGRGYHRGHCRGYHRGLAFYKKADLWKDE